MKYSGVKVIVFLSLLGLVASDTGADRREPARIGFLAWNAASCHSEAFMAGLRELGYQEGRDIVIDCHHAGGRFEGLAPAAEACARRKPDVIVAITHDYAEAARRVTRDIPIVMIVGGDPVAAGLVKSLAHPGGNITGVGHFSPELNAKRLELLKTIAPNIKRVAVLVFGPDKASDLGRINLRETAQAAQALGLEHQVFEVDDENDLNRVFDRIVEARADAVYVIPNRLFAVQMQDIISMTAWYRLPTVHFYEKYPVAGGLIAYGVDMAVVHRRAAKYVNDILKGAKPADLPIEQPTHFELVINLNTARELGLKVPPALLLRADRVVE